MKTRHHIAAIAGGIGLGAIIITYISKAVMEAGIFALSVLASIGTGYIVGKIAIPRSKKNVKN